MAMQRCTNPKAANYISYGGAGITFCERWMSFAAFFEDMGHPPTPKHTLDRIDNSKGYNPENCRWADVDTQQNNRGNVRKITAFGETLSVTQWARRTGMTKDMVAHRVYVMGMSPEEALTKPRMSHTKKVVIQKSLGGGEILRHASLADAARSLCPENYETTKKAIWQCLSGKAKTSLGFCWEYVSQDPLQSNTTDLKSL
jgi:hypothetical protein